MTLAVMNIGSRFSSWIHEYPSTQILIAALTSTFFPNYGPGPNYGSTLGVTYQKFHSGLPPSLYATKFRYF